MMLPWHGMLRLLAWWLLDGAKVLKVRMYEGAERGKRGDHWTQGRLLSAALWGSWLLLAVQGSPPPVVPPPASSFSLLLFPFPCCWD